MGVCSANMAISDHTSIITSPSPTTNSSMDSIRKSTSKTSTGYANSANRSASSLSSRALTSTKISSSVPSGGGHELWARDLLSDLGVETVQGTLHLDEIIEDLTLEAAQTLHETVDLRGDEVVKSDWKNAMTILRSDSELSPTTLQRVWWLFPLYRERPSELEDLLSSIIEKKNEIKAEKSSSESRPDSTDSECLRFDSETRGLESGTDEALIDDSDTTVSTSALDESIDSKQDGSTPTEITLTNETEGTGPKTESSRTVAEEREDDSETQNGTETDDPTNQGLVGRIRAFFGR